MAVYDFRAPRAAGRFGAWFQLPLAALFGAMVDWSEARAARRAFSGLSARELDDIGLSRGDIDRLTGMR